MGHKWKFEDKALERDESSGFSGVESQPARPYAPVADSFLIIRRNISAVTSRFFLFMASMTAKPGFVRKTGTLGSKWKVSERKSESRTQLFLCNTVRASHSMDDKNKVSSQLGLFSFSIPLYILLFLLFGVYGSGPFGN